MSQRP